MNASNDRRCDRVDAPRLQTQTRGRFDRKSRKARCAKDSEATTPPPSPSSLSSPPPMPFRFSEKVQHERRGEQQPPDDDRVDPRDPLLRPARSCCSSSGGGGGHQVREREREEKKKKRGRKSGFRLALSTTTAAFGLSRWDFLATSCRFTSAGPTATSQPSSSPRASFCTRNSSRRCPRKTGNSPPRPPRA